MPSQNQNMLSALQDRKNYDSLAKQDAGARNNAFHAILDLDPRHVDIASQLRTAIKTHKTFWDKFLPIYMSNTPSVANYFDTDQFINGDHIEDIQASLVVSSIALGLRQLSDEELKEIQRLRDDALKSDLQVLEGRFPKLLGKWAVWKDTERPFSKYAKYLVSIQDEATRVLLNRELAKPDDKVNLETLLKVSNELKLAPEEKQQLTTKIQQVKAGKLVLFKKLIDEMSDDDLLKISADDQLKPIVERHWQPAQYEQSDFESARTYLATRALKLGLAKFKLENLSRALSLDNDEAFKRALERDAAKNNYHFEHANVDSSLRPTVLLAMIKHPEFSLDLSEKIANAPDAQAFQRVLKDQKYQFPEQFNMQASQQAARTNLFRAKYPNRPALVQAFSSLDRDQQKKMLGSAKPYHAESTQAAIKELGVTPDVAKRVIEEQNNLQRFKLIHNPILAAFLAKQPLSLNDGLIDTINRGFVKEEKGELRARDNLSANAYAEYKEIMQNIGQACGFPGNTLSEKFAMSTDVRPTNIIPFTEQQTHNEALLAIYHARPPAEVPTDAEKKLISLILNLEKAPVAKGIQMVPPFTKKDEHGADVPKDLNDIRAAIRESKDVQDFAERLEVRPANESKNLLNHVLGRQVFQDAKRLERAKQIAAADPEAIGFVNIKVNEIQSRSAALATSSKKLKAIQNLDPVSVHHEFSQLFADQERVEKAKKQEAHYKQLAEETEDYLDQLYRDKADLAAYSKEAYLPETPLNATQVRPVKERVNQQVLEVEEHISFYQKLRNHLKKAGGILETIASAKAGTKRLSYRASGFDQPYTGYREAKAPAASTAAGANLGGVKTELTLAELEANQPIHHDYGVQGSGMGYTKTITSGDKSGEANVDYNVKDVPQDADYKRIEFFMGIAADILLELGENPPTRENLVLIGHNKDWVHQVGWALRALGKVHPVKKFGLEDINFSRSAFRPGPKGSPSKYDNEYFENPDIIEPLQKKFVRDMNNKLGLSHKSWWHASPSDAASAAREKLLGLKQKASENRLLFGQAQKEESDDAATPPNIKRG